MIKNKVNIKADDTITVKLERLTASLHTLIAPSATFIISKNIQKARFLLEKVAISAPSLTNNVSDITNGNYGTGSASITNNANWGIYANKLGLGQAIFESSGWSGAGASSVDATGPWFVRGGFSGSLTLAGVESLGRTNGGVTTYHGFRGEEKSRQSLY